MTRIGQNVRDMAARRRMKAIALFGLAVVGAIAVPLFIYIFFSALGSALPAWFPLVGIGAGFAIAVACIQQGRYLWRRANQADQGAAGEEAVAKTLAPLIHSGWAVEYGVRDRRVGDVDMVLVSPSGKVFTIDVKSHRGQVTARGDTLYRGTGKQRKRFEKNFINQAKRQAIAIRDQRQCAFVTPLIVFSNANVAVDDPIGTVYVTSRQEMCRLLRSLDAPVAPPNSSRQPTKSRSPKPRQNQSSGTQPSGTQASESSPSRSTKPVPRSQKPIKKRQS